MNKDSFEKEMYKIFSNVSSEQLELIYKYKDIVQSENKKYNLTRLDSEDKIYSDFLYESIFVYENLLENKNINLLDIGSGSGIPGILIKILFPNINVYIVESNSKKINFMNLVIDQLNLKNIFLLNERIEELDKKYINFFDIATCRAFAKLKIILEVSMPYLKINGILISPKSINYEFELEESNFIINEFNLDECKIINKTFNNKSHNILVFEKTTEINNKYPRLWKEIIK